MMFDTFLCISSDSTHALRDGQLVVLILINVLYFVLFHYFCHCLSLFVIV